MRFSNSKDLLQVDLTSLVARGASFLGREAAKQTTKSRHIKSDEGESIVIVEMSIIAQNRPINK